MKLEQTSFINGNKNLLYPKIPFFLSSRAYRDPTVPTTQYNGLCHVTLYHTYPLGSTIKLQEPSQETRNWGLPARINPPLVRYTQTTDTTNNSYYKTYTISLVITLFEDGSLHDVSKHPNVTRPGVKRLDLCGFERPAFLQSSRRCRSRKRPMSKIAITHLVESVHRPVRHCLKTWAVSSLKQGVPRSRGRGPLYQLPLTVSGYTLFSSSLSPGARGVLSELNTEDEGQEGGQNQTPWRSIRDPQNFGPAAILRTWRWTRRSAGGQQACSARAAGARAAGAQDTREGTWRRPRRGKGRGKPRWS